VPGDSGAALTVPGHEPAEPMKDIPLPLEGLSRTESSEQPPSFGYL